MRILTFGGLALERNGVPMLIGEPQHSARLAILAMLANAGEQGVLVRRFKAYLWPSHAESEAQRLLDAQLASLQQDCGHAVVERDDVAYRLAANISSDARDFERDMRDGLPDRAASCYSGPFLLGFCMGPGYPFDRWAEWERVRYAARYQEAVEAMSTPAGRPPRTSERLAAIVGRMAGKLRATPSRDT